MIVARNLERRFRTADGATLRVLDGVSLGVDPGEMVVIRGESGAGKTTLLQLLATLDRPDGGEIELEGRALSSLSTEELVLLRRRRLGVVRQEPALIDRQPVWQNVSLSLVPEGASRRERRALAAQALDRVGLLAKTDETPDRLSGGERQRVSIAQALLRQPRIIIADEPSSQVDGATADRILDLLSDLREQGAAVLIASHDDRVSDRADRVFVLAQGELVATETAP